MRGTHPDGALRRVGLPSQPDYLQGAHDPAPIGFVDPVVAFRIPPLQFFQQRREVLAFKLRTQFRAGGWRLP